jgi:dTDP-4-dehydrorhamnose reductase
MPNPKIIVTGANGQLAREIKSASTGHSGLDFIFVSREELPVHRPEIINRFFEIHHPDYCINCAAYTAVDRAESERELAFLVNAEAVGVLAEICKGFQTKFIHISTDYVFDGKSSTPLKEDDATNPLNIYGESKLEGEKLAFQNNKESIIIRTSWVYSEYGNNFVKTMIRLMQERKEISVVDDQVGAPTYAAYLSTAILFIIEKTESSPENWKPGTYHYSNKGKISWYDFAVAIQKMIKSKCIIHSIPTEKFPTAAKRPLFSLLDTKKIETTFQLVIPDWKEGLAECLKRMAEPKETK